LALHKKHEAVTEEREICSLTCFSL